MKKQLLLVLAASVLASTGAFASGSQEKKPMANDTMMKSDTAMKADDGMMKSDDGMMKSDSMMKSDAMMKDGVFKKDGKVMVTMAGKTTDLTKDVMLKDGTKIMMDGTIVMKNGSKGMLMNGDMYDMDGMKSMVDTGMKK